MTDVIRHHYGPGEWQFGELRVPAGAGPWPVVLSIHGGFWMAQYGLDLHGKLCTWLCRHGYATWNIEYRRVGQPGGGWPGTLQDAAAAADHLRALAAPYGLDPERVVALGHSAGGHLALWLAGRHRLAPPSPLHSPAPLPLRGVVALAAVADLELMAQIHAERGRPREESPVPNLLGGTPAAVPERVAWASPARLAPLGVPTVLVHGTADENVPLAVSMAYARVAGPEAALVELPGVDHFQVIDPESAAWPAVAAALARLLA